MPTYVRTHIFSDIIVWLFIRTRLSERDAHSFLIQKKYEGVVFLDVAINIV